MNSDVPRTNWLIDDYLDQGPRVRCWLEGNIMWHDLTVERYVAEFIHAGFTLRATRKCEPVPETFAGDLPEFDRRRRVC